MPTSSSPRKAATQAARRQRVQEELAVGRPLLWHFFLALGRATVARKRVAVVAVFGGLVHVVVAAARTQRAVGLAAAVATGVRAVVAFLAEKAVHVAVAAVAGQLAT